MSDNEKLSKIASLQARFKERHLNETINEIENLSAADLQKLIQISHTIAGSAGTFGFDGLSERMKEIELALCDKRDQTLSEDEFEDYQMIITSIIQQELED